MNTLPPATVGVDSMEAPVAPVHRGWHVAWPHPFALNAYNLPSKAPTNTTPFETAGEDSRIDWAPASPCHRGGHTDCPHPEAEKAFSLPSLELGDVCDPTYTMPLETVGESMIWASEVDFHSGVVHSDWPQPDAG